VYFACVLVVFTSLVGVLLFCVVFGYRYYAFFFVVHHAADPVVCVVVGPDAFLSPLPPRFTGVPSPPPPSHPPPPPPPPRPVTSRFTSSTLAKYYICVHWNQYSTFIHKMTPVFYSIQEVEIFKNSGPNKKTMQYIINTWQFPPFQVLSISVCLEVFGSPE